MYGLLWSTLSPRFCLVCEYHLSVAVERIWCHVLMMRINYVFHLWSPKAPLESWHWPECVSVSIEGYYRFQTEIELTVAYRCSKLNAYCLLTCQDNSTLIFLICQATVTLHQDQHEHEYICHAQVYRYAKFECHMLKYCPRYYYWSTSKTFVNFETQLWPWMKVKFIGLRKCFIALSSDYVHSKLHGDCLNSFWNSWTFVSFMIEIFVNLNEGQGEYN